MRQQRLANRVRIIAGKWRGRRLKIAPKQQVRPTTDRIRETLFNWLTPVIEGMICLDLFAGSGALGFEALSRGAEKVVMVDKSRKVISALQENAAVLQTMRVEFVCAEFKPSWTQELSEQFDLVFLDPPFHENLVIPAWKWLEQHECFKPAAWLYIEAEKELIVEPISEQWLLHRSLTTGNLHCYLFSKKVL